MKANELRIGNWAFCNGQYRQVVVIDAEKKLEALGYKGSVSLKQTEKHPLPSSPWCEQINPIPLTEEILIKAGAREFEGKKCLILPTYQTTGRAIWYDEGHLWLSEYDPVDKSENVVMLTTEKNPPVHILQNLFYILSGGTELEINL